MLSILIPFFVIFSWAQFVPTSFTTNFEESFISVTTGREKKSFGKIDYRSSGFFRYEKISPDQSLFVTNGDKSWYYVPPFISGEQGQVTIQKAKSLPLLKFFEMMKSGIKATALYQVNFQKDAAELLFNQSFQKEYGLKKVKLFSSDPKKLVKLKEAQKLQLDYLDGREVQIKFTDFKEGVSFSSGTFDFKIPANTKVTGN